MTTCLVRCARSWFPASGRRGPVPITARSPHHAASVVQRTQVVRGKDPGGRSADSFNGVERTRSGGDHAGLIMVRARSADVGVDLDPWVALDDNAVHPGAAVWWVGPLWRGDLGQPVHVFNRDHFFAVADSLHAKAHRGDLAHRNVHHGARYGFGSGPLFVAFAHLVELHSEIGCEAAYLEAPHRREHSRSEQYGFVLGVASETETDAGEFGVVVAAVVTNLLDGHFSGVGGQAQRGVHKRVTGETGIDGC